MTDFEISLERLKDVEPQDNWTEADWTHFKTIKLALEKQTPKEHHHTRVINIFCLMRQSICPECLSMINTAENEYPKFCTWCGQALDWGDYDSKDENDYKYLVDARIVKRSDKAFEILSTEQQGNNDKEDKNDR